jgi:EEF1A lysine methyltransferase 1
MDDADDDLRLPADTLQLLKDFQQEKEDRVKQFENLKSQAEEQFQGDHGKLSMDIFGEDWNASQFWYTNETASTLARQLLVNADHHSAIAVVSAPSVYVQLRNMLAEKDAAARPRLCLLEFDTRFEVVGPDFVHYDYQHPLRLPAELKGQFDRIICDPPFLSEDCQTKTALTVRYLSRNWSSDSGDGHQIRMLSCTGERMESIIVKLYAPVGLRTTTFEPEHSKGLSNEFRCYANFECDAWRWREPQLRLD